MLSPANILNHYKLAQCITSSHAVYNFLTAIQNKITFDEKRDALNFLSQFAKYIRKVNGLCELSTWPLAEELELLQFYINLEKTRFGEELEIEVSMEKGFPKNTQVPVLLLVPATEIILSLASKTQANPLKISLLLGQGLTVECHCLCEDIQEAKWNNEQNKRVKLVQEKLGYCGWELSQIEKNKQSIFYLKPINN
jgi:LytS/YehU family sensor histidine kinase